MDIQEDALVLTPREYYDPCIIGECAKTGRVIYSVEKILDKLQKDFSNGSEISEEDLYTMAKEHFEYNILGSYMGKMTPLYMYKLNS